jgi:NAD(P)H-dependent nitrite reductase small subunit
MFGTKDNNSDFVKSVKASELHNKHGKLFQLDEETEVAIFKVYDKVYVVDNVCPHNHSPLMHEGYIDELQNEMYVVCPIHGFQFHLKTGEQPHKMGCKLRTFEHKIENDFIYIKKPKKKIFNFKF